MNTDFEFSVPQQIESFYRQLVELLLHDIDSLDDDEKQNRLEESRIAIADLQQEELANFYAIASSDVQQPRINDIDPSVAVIYQIVLDHSLEVILLIKEQPLQHYRTEFTEDSQGEIFQEICQKLNPICQSADILPCAQKLYEWLILPAEDILQKNQITTLVFILDSLFRSLPMAVLHDGAQYLIEKYNIVLTPGLQFLAPQNGNKSAWSLLTGGLTRSSQECSPLPEVASEIAQISQIIPAHILLDEDFTTNDFRAAANSFSLVHLVTHCQLSSHADQTFIATSSDRLNLNHLSKFLAKNQTQSKIQLLVLTACQTVPEDPAATLALTAITNCFGARSTVATLWLVRDRSTASLMTEFYRLLTQANISTAEALRQAQISLLKDPQYQHPYYWSPFVLIGNWQ